MEQLARGVRDVERGLDVLRNYPWLWKWVVAPAVITLVLFVALVISVLHFADRLTGLIVAHLPGWAAHPASSVLTVVIAVALWTTVALVYVPLVGVIAGPFNETLSEQVEEALTGRLPQASSLPGFLHGLGLAIVHGLRRVLATLAGIAAVFLLGFVPVIGTVAAIALAVWLAAHGTAYDCYDAVFGRQKMAYGDKLAYLARHRGRTMGLGGTVAVMLLIPGVNLFALGVGATGATIASLGLYQGQGQGQGQGSGPGSREPTR